MTQIQAADDNRPPRVSILWPRGQEVFDAIFTLIKIKADAVDSDGSIAEVEFFADGEAIGAVTSAPFNLIWQVQRGPGRDGWWNLKAVAVDNLGARTESAPVRVVYVSTEPTIPMLEITAPRDGAMFAAPATFKFSAEVLASLGEAGPVEFYVGTNSVGVVDDGTTLTATKPDSTVMVNGLGEGNYKLSAVYRGLNGPTPAKHPANIHVVNLGVQLPSVTPDGRLQFEVVTSFPGRPAIIQASPNLLDWVSVSTNQPSSNSFSFTDPSPAGDSRRFYRVLVPPE